jgi:hypothetical protein
MAEQSQQPAGNVIRRYVSHFTSMQTVGEESSLAVPNMLLCRLGFCSRAYSARRAGLIVQDTNFLEQAANQPQKIGNYR